MNACTLLVASMLVAWLSPAAAPPGEWTGASLAWTSTDWVTVKARELVNRGELAVAEKLIYEAPAAFDPQANRARDEMGETIRRIRRDYSQTPEALLKKVQAGIPDLTMAELERWREAGQAQARTIDGQVRYFVREPSNIWLFNKEAIARRDAEQTKARAAALKAKNDTLHAHLADVIAAAKSSGKDLVVPMGHRISYALTVKPDRPGAIAGSTVRCWLPFPQEHACQTDVRLVRSNPQHKEIAPVAPWDGRSPMVTPHRTVYFEQRVIDPAKPITFEEEFTFTSWGYYPDLREELAKPLAADHGLDRYLAERPPHISFAPAIAAQVREIVGAEQNPLAKLRKIYHWMAGNVRWCAEQEYAILPNVSLKCFEARRADCGAQSLLLVTMCRIAGVPARWQSGWETQPNDWNMHDWAEVYIEPWGWLPCDASYSLRASDNPLVREFYIGHQDAWRLIVNADYGGPLQPAINGLRADPCDFQRGEVEIDGRVLYFDEWEYEFKLHPQTKLKAN